MPSGPPSMHEKHPRSTSIVCNSRPPGPTRVHRFHDNTLKALRELLCAAGLTHPSELGPEHVLRRVSPTEYRASFHAKYRKVLGFKYETRFLGEVRDGVFVFKGEEDLGMLAGGLYRYTGSISHQLLLHLRFEVRQRHVHAAAAGVRFPPRAHRRMMGDEPSEPDSRSEADPDCHWDIAAATIPSWI